MKRWFSLPILIVGAIALAAVPTATSARHDPAHGELLRNFTKDVPFLAGGWAAIRRSLLHVFGHVSDPQQLDKPYKDNSLLNAAFPRLVEDFEARAYLQETAPATAYLPTEFEPREPPPPGLPTPLPGDPTPDPCSYIVDMDWFLRNCAAPSRSPAGRITLLREAAMSGAAANQAADVASLLAYDGVQPEYLLEKDIPALLGPNPPPSPPPGGVVYDGAHVRIAAGAILGDANIAKYTHGIYANPSEVLFGAKADEALPSVDNFARDAGVCTEDPNSGETICSRPQVQQAAGLAGIIHTDCSTCSAAGAATAAVGISDLVVGTGRFFQLSLPTLAEQFFGENFLLYQALLGPTEFWNKAQALFRTAGNTTPPRPSAGTPQSISPCNASATALAPTQVAGIAQLLGVNAASGWTISYEPTRAIVGLSGSDPLTGRPFTVTPTHFRPADACVWRVSTATSDGRSDTAIISDTAESAGAEYRLLVTDTSAQ